MLHPDHLSLGEIRDTLGYEWSAMGKYSGSSGIFSRIGNGRIKTMSVGQSVGCPHFLLIRNDVARGALELHEEREGVVERERHGREASYIHNNQHFSSCSWTLHFSSISHMSRLKAGRLLPLLKPR